MLRFASILVLLMALSAQADKLGKQPRRWALVVGQNVGDSDEERLRFADSDAKNVVQVLQELGSVRPSDTVALYGATGPQLRQALQTLREKMAREGSAEDQLFIYVSSHADGGDLHLAGTQFPLAELTTFAKDAPVSVGIFILDSCRSGMLTRVKGLKPVEGVSIQLEAGEARGRVLISSSGADEYAQESDELQGSYFTHHFVSGLRGAADTSKDGRVSLQEAYAYAYDRTLESTFATRGGLQRPSYHIDLRGQGDLTLSELHFGKARLAFEDENPGRWQVLSLKSNQVVAQIEKPRGRAEIVLSPGDYRVRTRVDDGLLTQTITLTTGGKTSVRMSELRWTPLPRVAMKGGALLITGSLGASGTTGLLAGLPFSLGVEGRVHWVNAGWLGFANTLMLSMAYRYGQGVSLVRFTQNEFEVRGGLGRTFDFGRFAAVVAPELGATGIRQANLPDRTSRFALVPSLGLVMEARVRVIRHFGFFASAQGGLVFLRMDSGTRVTPRASISFGVSFEI